MKLCRTLTGIQDHGSYWSVQTDAAEFRIWFLTDDILRIRAGFDSAFEEASYTLTLTGWEDRMDDLLGDQRTRIQPKTAQLDDQGDRLILKGTTLTVELQKNPFAIQVLDADGLVLHRDLPGVSWQCDPNGRRIHLAEIQEGDGFYGFGERTGTLNKRNQYLKNAAGDTMGYDPVQADPLYKHIPFYIKLNRQTRAATGFFYHNTYESDFDLGRAHSNYWPRHSRFRADGGDLDLFILHGPKVRDILERYTDLTGKSVLLPKAALGYLGSSMYYAELPEHCDEEILDFIRTTEEEGIPADGFQLSSGWCEGETSEGTKRCTFVWNPDKFPDPKEFFTQMAEHGITVSPNVKPGMLLCHPFRDEMDQKGMFVEDASTGEPVIGTWWGGPANFVDFTKPEARAAWKHYLKSYVLDYGTASIWNDNCEYDSITDLDAKVSFEGAGGTIGQLKPVMANLMCQTTEEAIREEGNARPYIVCRAGSAGIQRLAQTWAGDNRTSWDSLKYNIATILGMSLSGVANQGCDIGGFYGPAPSAELFVRWVQNGIFQPRFSIHSTNTDNTVTEPWMYSNVKDLIRAAIELRYQMSPYLYSLMYRAHETGLPIAEPLLSAFQNDPDCYDEGVTYMFGDSLLVANVVEEGATERQIYLPKGATFYDYTTRKAYEGGQTITLPVDLQSIPLFLKSGAILPLSEDKLTNLSTQTPETLRILCVPDRDADFVLYDDDGTTRDYEQGVFKRTEIQMRSGEQTTLAFTSTGTYETKVKNLVIDMLHPEQAPFTVKVGNKELKHFLNRRKLDESESGWYYSERLKSVKIKYPNPQEDHTLTVSFTNRDLLGM